MGNKVCILSMQKVNNIGSLLQSYALKKILENFDCYVEFLDIKKIAEDCALLDKYSQEFNEEKELTGFLGKLSKIDKYTFNRFHIRKLANIQDKEFDNFRGLFLDKQELLEQFATCIYCGICLK